MSKAKNNNVCLNLVWGTVAFGGPSKRVVMAALADHATEDGYCFPGIDLLAAETELDEKTVRRSIKGLQAAGWLKVHAKSVGALHRHSAYTLNVPKLKASQRPTVDKLSAVTPDKMSAVDGVSGQNVRCTADIDAQKGDSESAVLEPPVTPIRKEPYDASASERIVDSGTDFNQAPRSASKPQLVPAATKAKAKPPKPEREPDKRIQPCYLAYVAYAAKMRVVVVWGQAEWGALRNLLDSAPTMTVEHFQQWLQAKARTPRERHGDPPHLWLGKLPGFAHGPLDNYGKPVKPVVVSMARPNDQLEQLRAQKAAAAAEQASTGVASGF